MKLTKDETVRLGVLIVLLTLFVIGVSVFGGAFVGMMAWNILAGIFCFSKITYWQAFWVIAGVSLVASFFKGIISVSKSSS